MDASVEQLHIEEYEDFYRTFRKRITENLKKRKENKDSNSFIWKLAEFLIFLPDMFYRNDRDNSPVCKNKDIEF